MSDNIKLKEPSVFIKNNIIMVINDTTHCKSQNRSSSNVIIFLYFSVVLSKLIIITVVRSDVIKVKKKNV